MTDPLYYYSWTFPVIDHDGNGYGGLWDSVCIETLCYRNKIKTEA